MRAEQHQQVGKAFIGQHADEGVRPAGPGILQRLAVDAADVDAVEGTVSASKPVAKTMMSNSYSAAVVRMPVGVMRSIGVALISTSVTLGWL